LITDFPLDRAESPAWLTVPLSKLYGFGAKWYHARYDNIKPYRPPVPVISVGNLAVGGTGKTPTVIALAQLVWKIRPELREPNRLAVLSRGYGRESRKLVVVKEDSVWEEAGDEPLLIKRALPQAAVVVHADRVTGARFAVEKLGARLLLLDDGFQHRRLARDLDIVLVDGEAPLGNGHLLPAGPLREPPASLSRASLILGVGENHGTAEELARSIHKPFASAAPQVRLPQALTDGSTTRVLALASIARPSRFSNSLQNKYLNVVGERFFPDHHRYTKADLDAVVASAKASGAEAVVTTEKDRVRIPAWPHPIPLLVTRLEMRFVSEAEIEDSLIPVISKT
jgi:tetraacyldisaccharide 4'-kinase